MSNPIVEFILSLIGKFAPQLTVFKKILGILQDPRAAKVVADIEKLVIDAETLIADIEACDLGPEVKRVLEDMSQAMTKATQMLDEAVAVAQQLGMPKLPPVA